LRPGDLIVRVVDCSESPRDPRTLNFPLSAIVFDGSFCRFQRRTSLRHLREVIFAFEFHKDVSLVYRLKVGNPDMPNDTGNLRAERRKVPPHVGVVRDLLDSATLPSISVPRDRDYYHCRKQDYR